MSRSVRGPLRPGLAHFRSLALARAARAPYCVARFSCSPPRLDGLGPRAGARISIHKPLGAVQPAVASGVSDQALDGLCLWTLANAFVLEGKVPSAYPTRDVLSRSSGRVPSAAFRPQG